MALGPVQSASLENLMQFHRTSFVCRMEGCRFSAELENHPLWARKSPDDSFQSGFSLPRLELLISTVCQASGRVSRKWNPFPGGPVLSDFILIKRSGAGRKLACMETTVPQAPCEVPPPKSFTINWQHS